MSTESKSLSEYDFDAVPSAEGMSFGIVVSEYNREITFRMMDACVETLSKHGAKEEDVSVVYVPGAFELPFGVLALNEAIAPDALICLGCVIKGETDHDIYISHAIAQGVIRLTLDLQKPVIFGVLTPNNIHQAKDRAGGIRGNKGIESAVAAIKMVALKKKL